LRAAATLLLIGAFSSFLPAQQNRDDLTPLDIGYSVAVLDDKTTVRVDIDVRHLARPTTRVALPNWTPGAYGIRRSAGNVENLTATSGGRALEALRIDPLTWSIATEGVSELRVSYDVKQRPGRFGSRATGGDRTGMQIAGPSTYLYVVGAKEWPVTVRYKLPEGWKYANGLLPTGDPLVRRAKDYDTFIDAPTQFGIFKQHDFEVNGTPFSCVFFENEQRYDFDLPAFVDLCKRIVTHQGKMFGSFPFPNYVFLFTIPGGGGLEHLNSTSIGLSAPAQKKDPRAGAFVTAHEFFHLWNVKRIRPKVLGPFEYEHENYTGNLWVSEGWTSYYGDLTLVRTGITSRDEFLSRFRGYVERELNKDARHEHSVYWASRNVWHRERTEAGRVDYYDKGEILGAMIDLKMRHETDNTKSLDDVMVFLNRWFAERNVGFEEGDVERACTAISNHDFGEFFARHVRGTLDPPLAEFLAYAGIEYTEQKATSVALPFETRTTADEVRVSNASAPGVQAGDVIKALGGQRLGGESNVQPADFVRDRKAGDKVQVELARDGRTEQVEVTLRERTRMTPALRFLEQPTEKQRRIRDGWLGGK
jgi:predicted metalloprotease with PDZ domain